MLKLIIKLQFVSLFLFSCGNDKADKAILMAEREAPVGWNYLRIYEDSSFEFEYKSFPSSTFYRGIVEVVNDTLRFDYNEDIPVFGDKAIIEEKTLIYINGTRRERLQIWLDSISNKN